MTNNELDGDIVTRTVLPDGIDNEDTNDAEQATETQPAPESDSVSKSDYSQSAFSSIGSLKSGGQAKKRIALPLIALLFIVLSVIALAVNWDQTSAVACVGATQTTKAVSTADMEKQQYTPQSINYGDRVVFLGRTEQLSSNSDCSDWVSSNSEAVTVSDSGEVSALSVGDAQVSCRLPNGDTYYWNIASRKVAYLTFDDFPNENTEIILDVLKEQNIKATFFLCRLTDESRFYLYERIRDEGHVMANHSSSHDKSTLFSDNGEFLGAFARMEMLMNEFGIATKYIRIPYGSGDPFRYDFRRAGVRRLRELGYTVVDWTASTEDSYNREQSVLLYYLKQTCDDDREIILMHNVAHTAAALPEIIKWLRDNGYGFETIADAPETYCAGYGWEPNINQNGAGLATDDWLASLIYPDGLY